MEFFGHYGVFTATQLISTGRNESFWSEGIFLKSRPEHKGFSNAKKNFLHTSAARSIPSALSQGYICIYILMAEIILALLF